MSSADFGRDLAAAEPVRSVGKHGQDGQSAAKERLGWMRVERGPEGGGVGEMDRSGDSRGGRTESTDATQPVRPRLGIQASLVGRLGEIGPRLNTPGLCRFDRMGGGEAKRGAAAKKRGRRRKGVAAGWPVGGGRKALGEGAERPGGGWVLVEDGESEGDSRVGMAGVSGGGRHGGEGRGRRG